MLERAGLARPATADDWGDEGDLEVRVRELADAGADEVVLWPFPVGDSTASLAATLDAMQELAAR